MKILYVDHPEPDYLLTQVYLGLCQHLGPDAVIDYPYKKTFHGQVHEYPSIYQNTLNSPDWRMTDAGPVETRKPFEWMPAQAGREWSRGEVIEALLSKQFSLVVLASPRKYNTEALADLIAAVGRDQLPPLVFVDGEDYDAIRWDLADQFRPSTYFKREMVAEPGDIYPVQRAAAQGGVRVLPLPFGAVTITPATAEVTLEADVVLLGGNNCPGGTLPYETAVRAATHRYVFGYLSLDAYVRLVSRSRITVALRGWGYDTMRLWEMLSIEGPMVAWHRTPLIRPEPLVDGRHLVEFGSPEELTRVLKTYLTDEPGRAAIAAAGHAHLKRHHTVLDRARYLLRESGVA